MIRATLTACVVAVSAVVAAHAPMKWSATLAPKGGTTIAGSATVDPAGASKATVTVMLTGATPGATYPWHIHSGSCTSAGGVVGPASAYTPITVGADGTGKVTVTLPIAAPDEGHFYVNIHKSASDMGTIVSCGNLGMAGM
jgi:hypothetical protein